VHYLSIETPERKVVPFILAAVAIGITTAIQSIAAALKWYIPSWISSPSAFAIYGLLYTGFENYFWRWSLFRSLGLIRVPNLKGEWNSTMSSSLENFEKEYCGPIFISQTWSRVHIFFNGREAFSHSQSASIVFMGPSRVSFSYVYQSEQRPEFSNNEYLHFGTCRLIGVLGENGIATSLEGSYFTDKSRNTYGRIKFERK